ncbi:MAG TPA: hypothetical protein VNE67_00825 [Acetobacteraceae bacterium]|nr:hypothetical protein [Acetobacteraceae bacterium]
MKRVMTAALTAGILAFTVPAFAQTTMPKDYSTPGGNGQAEQKSYMAPGGNGQAEEKSYTAPGGNGQAEQTKEASPGNHKNDGTAEQNNKD